MTGTELVNILKSPTSKIVIFGVLLIAGALLLIPLLNRNDKTSSIQENTELKQEEKAPIEIGSGIPQFKAEAEGNKTVSKASPPPPAVISRNSEKSKTPIRKDSGKRSASSGQSRKEQRSANPAEHRVNDRRGKAAANTQGKIFSINVESKNTKADNPRNEAFLSERYAPNR